MLAIARPDVVRIGKFDVDTAPRFLAFYGPPFNQALRVQANLGGRRPGIGRAIAARRLVDAHAPDLAPRMLDHGTRLRGWVDFLLEEVVDGRHPWGAKQLQQQIPELFERLHRLHTAVGIEGKQFSSVVHRDFRHRWSTVVDQYSMPAPLVRAVATLIDRDAAVSVSLTHGDLVASNIVVTDTGPTLIDWEHARSQPIATDLAKLELVVHEPANILDTVRQLAGAALEGPGCYSLPEQIALAHVEILSWDAHRRERAKVAGRTEDFELITRRRVERLTHLLGNA
jgi:hypothetical protein